MNNLEFAFCGLCSLIALLGGVATVAAKNPIRGAMGLLSTIIGIAGLYLTLSAEFLATIQLLVYAGAVVILFLFVIMLLGPSALSKREVRGPWARYIGAFVLFLASAAFGMLIIRAQSGAATMFAKTPAKFGTIESLGHELFTTGLIPFELSGALLLVAVIGAVAVARGKQIDPTLLPATDVKGKEAQS